MGKNTSDSELVEKYTKAIIRDDPYKLYKIYEEFGFPQYEDGCNYDGSPDICDDTKFIKKLLIEHGSFRCLMMMYKEDILP